MNSQITYTAPQLKDLGDFAEMTRFFAGVNLSIKVNIPGVVCVGDEIHVQEGLLGDVLGIVDQALGNLDLGVGDKCEGSFSLGL